jgi:hypothetical protein
MVVDKGQVLWKPAVAGWQKTGGSIVPLVFPPAYQKIGLPPPGAWYPLDAAWIKTYVWNPYGLDHAQITDIIDNITVSNISALVLDYNDSAHITEILDQIEFDNGMKEYKPISIDNAVITEITENITVMYIQQFQTETSENAKIIEVTDNIEASQIYALITEYSDSASFQYIFDNIVVYTN